MPITRKEERAMYEAETARLWARVSFLEEQIDCACNAINDAVNVSGGDLVRVNACIRRLRRDTLEKADE